ncbi:hypothetical protein P8C59_006949 [Phyllachora maydis]|uniref:NTF2-like domain-containing protein n=1 Tax=Phyllachora maydis TaxID=1825666 RepID=A0AAD9I937_9PEZI|nr:hypothetical protein P8C59_006949 [Phyllachora maydis]
MHIFPAAVCLALALALASSSAAGPPVAGRASSSSSSSNCLCPGDVDSLVGAYVSLLSNYTDATANEYLVPDFTDTSDSINILAGNALGSVTFGSKQAFMQKEEAQPDNLPIQVSSVGPVSCDKIALIWTATFGAGRPVRGITILTAVLNGIQWQIQSFDVEFDNMAYLVDIGGSYKLPGQ